MMTEALVEVGRRKEIQSIQKRNKSNKANWILTSMQLNVKNQLLLKLLKVMQY
jgi:hypothetical protein